MCQQCRPCKHYPDNGYCKKSGTHLADRFMACSYMERGDYVLDISAVRVHRDTRHHSLCRLGGDHETTEVSKEMAQE